MQSEHCSSANDGNEHGHKKRNQDGTGRLNPRYYNGKTGQDQYYGRLGRGLTLSFIEYPFATSISPFLPRDLSALLAFLHLFQRASVPWVFRFVLLPDLSQQVLPEPLAPAWQRVVQAGPVLGEPLAPVLRVDEAAPADSAWVAPPVQVVQPVVQAGPVLGEPLAPVLRVAGVALADSAWVAPPVQVVQQAVQAEPVLGEPLAPVSRVDGAAPADSVWPVLRAPVVRRVVQAEPVLGESPVPVLGVDRVAPAGSAWPVLRAPALLKAAQVEPVLPE